MGVKAILEQDPMASLGDSSPSFARNPRIACKAPALRIALLHGLQEWRGRYRVALDAWTQGDRSVAFPRGSYWLPRFHKALVEPSRAPP